MKLRKFAKKIAIGTTALVMSSAAFAADYTAQIATAQTEGQGNVSAVVLAVLGIATLSFGATALLRWLNK